MTKDIRSGDRLKDLLNGIPTTTDVANDTLTFGTPPAGFVSFIKTHTTFDTAFTLSVSDSTGKWALYEGHLTATNKFLVTTTIRTLVGSTFTDEPLAVPLAFADGATCLQSDAGDYGKMSTRGKYGIIFAPAQSNAHSGQPEINRARSETDPTAVTDQLDLPPEHPPNMYTFGTDPGFEKRILPIQGMHVNNLQLTSQHFYNPGPWVAEMLREDMGNRKPFVTLSPSRGDTGFASGDWGNARSSSATTGTTSLVVTDSTASYTVDALIGLSIENTDDDDIGIITDNDGQTITVESMDGGTAWVSGKNYRIIGVTKTDGGVPQTMQALFNQMVTDFLVEDPRNEIIMVVPIFGERDSVGLEGTNTEKMGTARAFGPRYDAWVDDFRNTTFQFITPNKTQTQNHFQNIPIVPLLTTRGYIEGTQPGFLVHQALMNSPSRHTRMSYAGSSEVETNFGEVTHFSGHGMKGAMAKSLFDGYERAVRNDGSALAPHSPATLAAYPGGTGTDGWITISWEDICGHAIVDYYEIEVRESTETDWATLVDAGRVSNIQTGSHTAASSTTVMTESITGTHDGGDNNATVMTDSGASFVVDGLIGRIINNTTKVASGRIIANDGTSITVAALTGGVDWDDTDGYSIDSFVDEGLVGRTITNATKGVSAVVTTNDTTSITTLALPGGNDWDATDVYTLDTSALDTAHRVFESTGLTIGSPYDIRHRVATADGFSPYKEIHNITPRDLDVAFQVDRGSVASGHITFSTPDVTLWIDQSALGNDGTPLGTREPAHNTTDNTIQFNGTGTTGGGTVNSIFFGSQVNMGTKWTRIFMFRNDTPAASILNEYLWCERYVTSGIAQAQHFTTVSSLVRIANDTGDFNILNHQGNVRSRSWMAFTRDGTTFTQYMGMGPNIEYQISSTLSSPDENGEFLFLGLKTDGTAAPEKGWAGRFFNVWAFDETATPAELSGLAAKMIISGVPAIDTT